MSKLYTSDSETGKHIGKRCLVLLGIIAFFTLISWFCYEQGKAWDIRFENLALQENEKSYEPLEAVNIWIDDQVKPVYMLADDEVIASAVGRTHVLRIDMLDEDDVAIPGKSRQWKFSIAELGAGRVLNVPKVYELAEPVK